MNIKNTSYDKSELNYPKYLPRRDDPIYDQIGNFQEYEYNNCIAYEMLIRTKDYKELISVKLNERDNLWKEKIKQLGLNPDFIIGLYKENKHFINFKTSFNVQDISGITLKDIDKGLERIVDFYVRKNKIYSLKKNERELKSKFKDVMNHRIKKILKQGQIKFVHKKNISLKKVLSKYNSYYVPCKYLDDIFSNKTTKLYEINENLPLEVLEKKFLEEIYDFIPIDKNVKIISLYSRPILKFDESRIIDISLNIDLPEDELISYISKLKEEYVNNSIIKNFREIFFGMSRQKSNEHTYKDKENIADAFFCYDYYCARKEYIENRNKQRENRNNLNNELHDLEYELRILKNIDFEDNKTQKIIDLKSKIKKLTLPELKIPTEKKNSKDYVFGEEFFKLSGIKSNKAYEYFNNIKPYISDNLYKNLIIGIPSF